MPPTVSASSSSRTYDGDCMKLLLDQNLSPRLVHRLADLYPDAAHVSLVGLDRASDGEVWDYAQANDCIIVTKDADFSDMSVLRGHPPKIIWLRLGNCTTSDVEQSPAPRERRDRRFRRDTHGRCAGRSSKSVIASPRHHWRSSPSGRCAPRASRSTRCCGG